MPQSVLEPARELSIFHEADLCVLGGSCTGLFAAIRAARLGASVVIVEKQNCFGGVATTAMVNAWHSWMDTDFKRQIIRGLTAEVGERLKKRDAIYAVEKSHSFGFMFNSEELKIELDELATESRLKIFFHTAFCQPYLAEGRLKGVIVENKSGRGAILARTFIDATGDGDLCARLPGVDCYFANHLQPATACARIEGWRKLQPEAFDSGFSGQPRKFDAGELVRRHGAEFGLNGAFMWGGFVPNSDIYMMAGTRVYGVNPAHADQLTAAEIEGRRQVRAILDLLRKYGPEARLTLQALPSQLGLRESRHVRCLYELQGADVLHGRQFADGIANGSYRVDIHHQEKPGVTLRYLDGTQIYAAPGQPREVGRWREESLENPTFYQIPIRSMLPAGPYENLIVAGRMIDADPEAHGAIRVMVNLNQTGEAAGVACVLAMRHGSSRVKVLTWVACLGPLTLVLIWPLNLMIALTLFSLVGAMCLTWFFGTAALVGELLPKHQVAGAMGIVGAAGALGGLVVNAAIGPTIDRLGFGPTLALLAFLHPVAALVLRSTVARQEA
jgi:hypothetical protein